MKADSETYISFSSVKLAISAGIGPCSFFEEKFLRNNSLSITVLFNTNSQMQWSTKKVKKTHKSEEYRSDIEGSEFTAQEQQVPRLTATEYVLLPCSQNYMCVLTTEQTSTIFGDHSQLDDDLGTILGFAREAFPGRRRTRVHIPIPRIEHLMPSVPLWQHLLQSLRNIRCVKVSTKRNPSQRHNRSIEFGRKQQ